MLQSTQPIDCIPAEQDWSVASLMSFCVPFSSMIFSNYSKEEIRSLRHHMSSW